MPKSTYIAGPMRGIPQFNFPAFFAADDRLRRAGYRPINPAARDYANGFDAFGLTGNEPLADLGFDLREALAWDMKQIAKKCISVAVLPGWERSSGARAEVALAHALGLLVFPVDAVTERGDVPLNAVIKAPAPPSGNEPEKTPPPALIGIGGALASGKDTVADRLVDEFGFVKLNMSEVLHAAMLAIDPLIPLGSRSFTAPYERYSTVVEHIGYTKAKENAEVRRLLQKLGTEVGRDMIGEDTWVDILGRKIDAYMEAGKSVVITGIRFPNEVAMIGKRNGDSWWVERDVNADQDAKGHASENSIGFTHFDTFIDNNGTIDDLYSIVDSHAASMGFKRRTVVEAESGWGYWFDPAYANIDERIQKTPKLAYVNRLLDQYESVGVVSPGGNLAQCPPAPETDFDADLDLSDTCTCHDEPKGEESETITIGLDMADIATLGALADNVTILFGGGGIAEWTHKQQQRSAA